MEGTKTNKFSSSIISFFIIWLVYVVFYGCVTTIIRENGYLNYEPLFTSFHLNVFLNGEGNVVKDFFLSYPLLTNILSYPFSVFSLVDAPFFASIFYTSLFSTYIVYSVGAKQNRVIKIIFFLYLLVSPITIYAATSGTSVYAFYILYFLIFFYLFNYIKKFTTYHITILSIILSFSVVLDYRILWILLILFFHVFVFSIYGVKGLSSNPIVKFVKITQNISLRRKYIGHLNSMVFIIGFFPLVTLILYFFINYLMGDNSLYFYNNPVAKWNGHKILSIVHRDLIAEFDNKAVNDFSFLKLLVFLIPLYLLELFTSYKKELKMFLLLSVPLLLFVLVRDSKIEYMGLFYYIVFISSSIASVVTRNHNYINKKILRYFAYVCVLCVSVYAEYEYFKKSTFTSESLYYTSIVNNKNSKILEQYRIGGTFLKVNTNSGSIVLCDRSIMYPLIAYNDMNNVFIENGSADFQKALYNPKKHCDYMVISNEKSPFYETDKINVDMQYIYKRTNSSVFYRSKIIFTCDFFRIVEIIR